MSKLYSQLNDLTSQIENLEEENIVLKEQITELKTKLYDATVKEQRLLKILKETSD